MNTMSHYRPSKRPSVKQVERWDTIYSDYHYNDWRGDGYTGEVMVEEGRPFFDFYRVTWKPTNGKKVSKLFYGETAHHDVRRYVYDLGFAGIDLVMF